MPMFPSDCAEVLLLPGWSLAEPHFADGFRYYGRRGSEDELDHPDLLSKEHLEFTGVPFSSAVHSSSALFFAHFFFLLVPTSPAIRMTGPTTTASCTCRARTGSGQTGPWCAR